MDWATDFALESRRRMLEAMTRTFAHSLERIGVRDYEPSLDAFINIHHNFARLEEHGGEQVVVHRKGATSAATASSASSPASWARPATSSAAWATRRALKSCSHGAGRRMGRNAGKQGDHRGRVRAVAGGHLLEAVDALRRRGARARTRTSRP